MLAGSWVIAGLFVQSRPRKHHQIRILNIHSKTSVINDPPFIVSDTGTFLRLRLRLCLSLPQCLRLSPCLRPRLRLRLHQRLCLYILILIKGGMYSSPEIHGFSPRRISVRCFFGFQYGYRFSPWRACRRGSPTFW